MFPPLAPNVIGIVDIISFKKIIMNCNHRWGKTYTYLSQKDIFASPLGQPVDQSGTLTKGQKCKHCREERTEITTYAKDGSIEKVTYR